MRSPLDVPAADGRRALLAGGAIALVSHALIGVVALTIQPTRPDLPRTIAQITEMVEVELRAEPEPEPEKPVEPPPVVPPAPRTRSAERAPAPEPVLEPAKPAEPPPAAAQAAQVLTQAPEAPVDFGDSFVQGSAASYAGGVSQAGGTSTVAVRDTNARAGGVPGGTGSAVARPCVPQQPQLAEGVFWDCPTPEEAELTGVESGLVTLDVSIGADGRVESVAVKKDPGSGFGREARRCAMRKRWQPGRDCQGKPMAARALVNVRFEAR